MLGKNTNKEEVIATFSHLEHVQIGKNNFTNEDLEKYFGAMGKITGSNKPAIILLKQVFQKEYPITRLPHDKSLPRVPTRKEEKSKLIECITRYFNHLRSKIIFKKYKTGDSTSLREMLSELQSIKVLKEHFEETKETFPYHMFADYLTNADFINLKGDIASQMRGLESNKVQDERIRNLLRQFTVTYLKNKNNRRFVLNDPGVSEKEFEPYGIMPSILEDLLAFINDKQATFKNNKSYDVDISSYLQEMRNNIEKLKEKSDGVSVPSGGGSDDIKELQDIKDSYNKIFDSMYSKYYELLDRYTSSKTAEDCENDLKYIEVDLEDEKTAVANSEDRIRKLTEEKTNLERKIEELGGRIPEKDKKYKKLNKELTLLRTELATCKANLVTATKILEENLKVKDSTQDVTKLTKELAELTADLKKREQEQSDEIVSNLKKQRRKIQTAVDLALTNLNNQQETRFQQIQLNIQNQVERYTQTIEEKNREIDAAKARATTAEILVARLTTQVESKEEEVIAVLRAASEASSQATARAANEASTAERNLATAQGETRRATEKLATLESSLNALRSQRTEEIRNATDAQAAVITQLTTARAEAEAAHAAAVQRAAEDNQKNLAEIARIRREASEETQAVELQYRTELDRLRAEIGSLKTTDAQQKLLLEEVTNTIRGQYREVLENLTNTIQAQNATITQLTETNSDNIKILNQRIADLQGAEGQATALASKNLEALQAAQAQLASAKASISELSPKYEQLIVAHNEAQSKLEACQQSMRDKTAENTLLQSKIGQLQIDIGRREAELEAAIQNKRASAQSESSAQSEVALARQKLSEAEQAYRTLKEQSDAQSQEIIRVKKDNDTLVTQKDNAEIASRRTAAEAAEREASAAAEVANLRALESSARKKEEEAEAAKRAALASLSVAEVRASEAEGRASVADWKASEAEERASEAEEKASEAEGRAFQASTQRNDALATAKTQADLVVAVKAEKDAAVKLANERVKAAEAARKAAEDRTTESQKAAKEAEAKVILAEKAKREVDNRLSRARFDAQFANERADLAEQSASESQTREKRMLTRAIESEKGRRAAVLSEKAALESASQAEVALSRAIEAQQTAVEARSVAELARDDAIRRAQNAERSAQTALQEAQASKIQQEKLIEINSKIVGLEQEVETLKSSVIELKQRIVDAKEEIKAQQQQISDLTKSKKTIFGAIQERFDKVAPYLGVGGKNDTLLEYCNKVANDSLNTFLLEEPLPFFSLIEDFEKGSKMDILKTTNEEYILKQFIQYHLEEHFNSKEMKEFYFHAKEIFGKQDCAEYAKMFFVLNEIINVIRSSKEDINVVRIKSKEYNSSFDYLEYILQDYEYDFYTVAKKKFLLDDSDVNPFDLTFIKENIYISVSKGSKTYDFNKNLSLSRRDFDFKSDIYYISSHMIYLFFILSTHFYLQSENMIDTDEYFTVSNNLEKTVRKLKRTKNKEKKSIAKLFKERKEFKLDE